MRLFITPRRGKFVIRAVDGETFANGEISSFVGGPWPTRQTVARLQSATREISLPVSVSVEVSIDAEAFRSEFHVVDLKEGWNHLEAFG